MQSYQTIVVGVTGSGVGVTVGSIAIGAGMGVTLGAAIGMTLAMMRKQQGR